MSQISVSDQVDYQRTHPLVARIARLRGRVRTVVCLFGLGLLITALVGGAFALATADYFFHMPSGLRLTLLILFIIGMAVTAWRVLMLPLTTRLTDQFLASRVEQMNSGLADELMSAVHFIHARAASSNILAAKQIDLAAQKSENVRFEDAVDFRRAGKSLGIGGLAFAIVTLIALLNPSLTRIAFSRWLSASPQAWPRTTHVAFDWSAYGGTQPKVIPQNEAFTIRAKVDKGGSPRVWLASWSDKGPTEWQLMQHQQAQSTSGAEVYEALLQPTGNRIFLRVQAGDDKDEAAIDIGLAARPVITELEATVFAPAYAKDPMQKDKPAPAMKVNLMAQAGRATKGAQVSLHIRATKPFQKNDRGEPDVALYDQTTGEQIPLAMNRHLISPTEADLTFTAEKTIQARMTMRDADGFENRVGEDHGGGSVTLEVVPDAMPSVVITDPRRAVERSPTGVVELTIQGTDDWGFKGLKIRADRYDAKETDPPAFETTLDWQELTVDHAAGSVNGKTHYTWELTPLKFAPGTRLTFYAMVQDNYEADSAAQGHDWVKSAPLSLIIKSDADIAEAARKQLSELADRLRNLRAVQDQTRAQTDSIKKIVTNVNAITAEQRTQLGMLTQQQTQESATANSIQQRAEQIADDLKQNRMQDGDLGKLADDVSAGMKDVGQQNMPRAAAELSKAQDAGTSASGGAGNPQQSTAAMAGANGQQDQAIETMDRLLRNLAATGDFETLRHETAKMLQQQRDLNDKTKTMAPNVVGKSRDALTPQLRDQEDKLAAQQRDLSQKTNDLLDRLDKASQASSQSDPASSQSMQSASNTGRQANVSGNQQSASTNISSNAVSDAGNSQTSATQGLQAMLDELNKNDLRKLQQLARELRQLIQDVQKLRDDEDQLNKDTVAAGKDAAKPAIAKLADRQGKLQQNAIIIEKKAENTPRAGEAARFIGEASDAMVSAASVLGKYIQPDAIKPEADAVVALDNALAELKKAQQQVEPDAKSKQLAEFIKQYEAIKKDQTGIKDATDAMEKKRLASDDKELDHEDEDNVGKLAKTQGGLIDHINTLSQDDELSKYDVVVWMNGQVIESMTDSKGKIEKQQLGAKLASSQQQALDRLQLILDALKEEQSKPEFNNSGGGGGGGKPPLIPPVTQLKLLKAMQVVINAGTKTESDAISAADNQADKNEHQTQVEKLGQKENQIGGMARKLLRVPAQEN